MKLIGMLMFGCGLICVGIDVCISYANRDGDNQPTMNFVIIGLLLLFVSTLILGIQELVHRLTERKAKKQK